MKTRDEYLRIEQWRGMEMLARHELLEEGYWNDGDGARWLIGRPRESFGLTEIIAGVSGSLVVHGDFQLCRFSYGDRNAWLRLLWMADCRDIDHYVSEKAHIGIRSDLDDYDEQVARHELIAYAKEAHDDDCREKAAVLRGALQHTDSWLELRQYLSDEGSRWDLWEMTPGRVPGSRVIIAHLAMNKCASLLRQQHGAGGPPACRPRQAAE